MRQVERQVVTTGDEPKPLVRRASFEVAHDVAAEMQGVAAEVGDGEHRYLDVAEIVDSRGVVRLVEVAMLAVVDRLVASEFLELLLRDDAFDTIRTCAGPQISAR